MLAVSNLFFEYADVPLLNNINFTLHAGELLHIQGQNGAGKSTLLKLLATLLYPSSGEIQYHGVPLQQDLDTYRADMSYLGHLEGVHPLLTAREVWAFESTHSKNTPSLELMVDLLQLKQCLDTPFALLSLGQKKRVGLIRLLMKQSAKVWLLDEPWSGLDVVGTSQLISLITEHLNKGGLLITTSHQPLLLDSVPLRAYVL